MVIASPRASVFGFPTAPPSLFGDLDQLIADGNFRQIFEELIKWQRLTAEAVNGAMSGKLNILDTLTLTISVASTTVTDPIISGQTILVLVPTTANASAEIGNGTIYQTYPNATEGQAVINHANSAVADRTFATAFLG